MATIIDFVKNKIFSFNGEAKKLSESPRVKEQKTFLTNSQLKINNDIINQFDVWYNGNSDELLNFYSAEKIKTYASDPIYFRNCENYFWSKSAGEKKIKRSTAGLLKSIDDTINNIIGVPAITIENDIEKNTRLESLIEKNNFYDLYFYNQLVYTKVEGWGAYRIDLDGTDTPVIRYYGAKNTFFVYQANNISAIIYTDYYTKSKENNGTFSNKNYVLIETRYVKNGNSCIDKDLFKIDTRDNLLPISLNDEEADFLQDRNEHIEIQGLNFILGEPCIFSKLQSSEDISLFGRSFYHGKIDLLDDYDQAISIASTNIRRSTAKITYPTDAIGTNSVTGQSETPDSYDTQYIQVPYQISGDGTKMGASTPQVVQPLIDMTPYLNQCENILHNILQGIISPADFGIDLAKKDNASAIREKERQTLFTRNMVCDKEKKFIISVLKKALVLEDVIRFNKPGNYDNIQVKFDKFANPSKEERLTTWLPVFNSGAISIERFIEEIYQDELSDEEKQKEIERLKNFKEPGIDFNL